MDPAITRMIENLNPKPADLRNPAALKSKNEAKRFISIRDGHRGTAMFPKKDLLSDQDIYDILAYLAILRSQGPVQKRKGP
jgi:cytochrome c553